MKKKMIAIGLVQSKVSANLADNLKNTLRMIRQAAKQGAQIVCLQELFRTPYFPQVRNAKKDNYAETIPGETTRAMAGIAKELKIVIIVPMFEKATNGKYYNTAVVIDEKGKIVGKYHKTHIPQDPGFYEKDYFEHGKEGYTIFKTKFGAFAVLICYDQWFPEAAREVKLAGAEMIFYPTAIGNIIGQTPPEGDWHEAWETVMRGHAIANSLIVAAVNRVGRENHTKFFGQSFISDAFGKILKRADKNREQIIIAKLDLAMNKYISDGWGFLHNRRPDSYKLLNKIK